MELALFVVAVWMLCVCLHEFAHAVVAYAGGDDTVREKGYLTLNFIKYINPSTSLILPLLIMAMGGIGLPGAAVYITESKLRNRFWRSAVAAAGPLMTALLTYLLAYPIAQGMLPYDSWICQGLAFIVLINAATSILNLLPIPPLDGYGIIRPWLPQSIQAVINRSSGTGMIVIIYLAFGWIPALNDLLWGTTENITQALGVPMPLVAAGYRQFHKTAFFVVLGLLVAIAIIKQLVNPNKKADPTPPAPPLDTPVQPPPPTSNVGD